MKFLLPIRTNPQTGKRELNGFFLLLVILAAGLFMYFGFFSKKTNIVQETKDDAIAIRNHTERVITENADTEMLRERDQEIANTRETQSKANPEEQRKREAAIREKYKEASEIKARNDAQTNLDERLKKMYESNASPEEIERFKKANNPALDEYKGWVPYSIRKEKGMVKDGANRATPNTGLAKTPEEEKKNHPAAESLTKEATILANYQNSIDFDQAEGDQNFLPLGSYVPVVLMEDIVTSDLQQYVTASVAQDVTFRKRMQLPKGAVMFRGRTGTDPVQNVADVHFDVMIFADGTELPCSGIATSALDVRYPDRFRTRGIPGTIVTPPLYIKAKALYYTAIAGGIESYMQDTQTNQMNGQGDVTIQPPESSKNYYDYFSGRNPRYMERAIMRGTADTLKEIKDDLQSDMRKYRPYVKIEKGTPFFIQMEQTVNLNARTVNGLAKAQSRDREFTRTTGEPQADTQIMYPPGDARANYRTLTNPLGFSGNQATNALPVTGYPTGLVNPGLGTTTNTRQANLDQQLQIEQIRLLQQAQEQARQNQAASAAPQNP